MSVSEKQKGEQGLPRIIRLSRKLKLSEKESLVLIYAFVTQVAKSRNSIQGTRYVNSGNMFFVVFGHKFLVL